ncbi:MAG: hypothetical protein HOE85_02765, partial [Nitrospinaceae bacterium]|nr:hypothetical protein [Nitrospinaceae bacterium]
MLKRICMTLLAAAVIVVLSAPRPVIAAPGEVVYSENFTYRTGYAAGDPQWDNWKTFRADVKANIATTSSVTISGSRDPVGATCSDPVKAQQIASALGNGPYLFTLSCDGRTWNVGQCGYGIEINSNTLPVGDWQRTRVCRCLTSNAYIVRPTLWNRSNSNWGGINGPTCRGPSQSLKVTFVVGPQLIEVDLDIKPGGEPNSINTGSKGNIPVAILSD